MDVTLSDLGAIGSFLAALAALVSTTFAGRSARDAKRAQELANVSEQLRLRQAVELNAKRAELAAELCEETGTELKIAYDTLFSFSGLSGGSRLELYKNRVSDRLGRVAELKKNADSLSRSVDGGTLLSINDYTDRLTRAENYAGHLQNIHAILNSELARIEKQNDQHRAEVIKKPSR